MIEFRRIRNLWYRFDVTVRDLPLGLLFFILALVPAFHGSGTQIVLLPARPFDEFAIVVAALQSLPLALRRRWPAVCMALVSVGFVLDQIIGYHSIAGTVLPIALVSTAVHLSHHRRTAVVVLSVAYVPFAVTLAHIGPTEGLVDFVTLYVVLVACWGVGSWVRSARAAEAERRLRVAEAARAAERTRIARELHDVVSHHVTAMVVQTEAARYITAAPKRLDETLSAVTDTGRRAMTDLRRLLDVLDPDHENTVQAPSVAELHTLVEHTRRAGQPIEFTEEGRPSHNGGSAEYVAYRAVQEALTNALKYAHGSRTTVHVGYGEEDITVKVSTDDSGARLESSGGSGRGLSGLGDRVDALGGEFSADRQTDGGFVVRARIPTGVR